MPSQYFIFILVLYSLRGPAAEFSAENHAILQEIICSLCYQEIEKNKVEIHVGHFSFALGRAWTDKQKQCGKI